MEYHELYETNNPNDIFEDDIYKEDFMDGTLRTDDNFTFQIHRILLAQKSRYFRALFRFYSNKSNEILVPGVRGQTMDLILRYIYSGRILLVEEIIAEVAFASDYLILDSLLNLVRSFVLQTLHIRNCLSYLNLGYRLQKLNILNECIRFIMIHFEEIVLIEAAGDNLEEIPFEIFKEILSQRSLNVTNEKTIWIAIKSWVSSELRYCNVSELIASIRLNEDKHEKLAQEILSHSIVKSNPHCDELQHITRESHRTLTDCSVLRLFGKTRFGHSLSQERIPQGVNYMARYSENHFGSDIFLTYDEKFDYFRHICEVPFLVDTMCVVDNILFMFDTGRNLCSALNVETGLWTDAVVGQHRYNYMAMDLDDFLYITGGTDEFYQETDSVEFSDSSTNFWMTIRPPIAMAAISDALVYEGKLFIFGHTTDYDNNWHLICQTYKSESNTWDTIQSPKVIRTGFSAAVYRDKIYLVGGQNQQWDYVKALEIYDPQRDVWERGPELPYVYPIPKAKVIDETLVVSNSISESRSHPSVYWNCDSGVWSHIDKSSYLFELEKYCVCSITNQEIVKKISETNRMHGFQWTRKS